MVNTFIYQSSGIDYPTLKLYRHKNLIFKEN
jgi:hypothetical protein